MADVTELAHGALDTGAHVRPQARRLVEIARHGRRGDAGEPGHVPYAGGAPAATWAIETDSVNQLRALGWDTNTLQVGDKVVAVVSKSKFDDTAGRLRDLLVYGSTPDEPAAVYLEFKGNGKPEWQAPLEVYQKHTPCPGTAPYDPERQPGKETLLCARLSAAELAAAKQQYGARVLLLRDAK